MDALLDRQKALDGALVVDTQEYVVQDYVVSDDRLFIVKPEPRIIDVETGKRVFNG